MTVFGADYSAARPSAAQLTNPALTAAAAAKAGATSVPLSFVVRYVESDAHDAGKRLLLSEARSLTAQGHVIVGNFEYETGAMSQGRAKGIAHAQEALHEYQILGVPRGRPCIFSDDQGDTQAASILAYLSGAASVLTPAGYGTGIYGGLNAIRTAYDAGYRWLWQTYGWSGVPTVWHPGARLRQIHNGAFIGWDGDLCTAQVVDFGQWNTNGWTPGGDVMDFKDTPVTSPATPTTPGSYSQPRQPFTGAAPVMLGDAHSRVVDMQSRLAGLEKALAALTAKVDTMHVTLTDADRAAIVSGVIAGLPASSPRAGTWSTT